MHPQRPASVSFFPKTKSAEPTDFISKRDRHKFAAARGILRELLARYLNREPALLRFAYNENGKPALADGDRGVIEFNLSHSHDRVLYAFTLRGRVGVDVERIRPAALDAKIAERFFSNKEAAALAALPEADRCQAFFLYWAAKEAYIKARGRGPTGGIATRGTPTRPPPHGTCSFSRRAPPSKPVRGWYRS